MPNMLNMCETIDWFALVFAKLTPNMSHRLQSPSEDHISDPIKWKAFLLCYDWKQTDSKPDITWDFDTKKVFKTNCEKIVLKTKFLWKFVFVIWNEKSFSNSVLYIH